MNTRTRQTENMNAFRALDLPAYATERQVVARVDELRAAAAAGIGGTPDSATVEAAALRLRQPDMRLVDSLVWSQADLLGQAEDAANGPAPRLRALAAYVKTLTNQLAESGVRDAMSAAGLTAQEAAALCCKQLRPALRGFDKRPWGATANKAAQDLVATLNQCEGFAGLTADVPCAPAPQAKICMEGQGLGAVQPEYTLREWVRDLLGLVVRAVRVVLQVSLAAACVAIPLWAFATLLHALSPGSTAKAEHATVQPPPAGVAMRFGKSGDTDGGGQGGPLDPSSEGNGIKSPAPRPTQRAAPPNLGGPEGLGASSASYPSPEELAAASEHARWERRRLELERLLAESDRLVDAMEQQAEEDDELDLDSEDDDADQLYDSEDESDADNDEEVAYGHDDAE